jgi:hypothetical protein
MTLLQHNERRIATFVVAVVDAAVRLEGDATAPDGVGECAIGRRRLDLFSWRSGTTTMNAVQLAANTSRHRARRTVVLCFIGRGPVFLFTIYCSESLTMVSVLDR